jgi:hypothetical protein
MSLQICHLIYLYNEQHEHAESLQVYLHKIFYLCFFSCQKKTTGPLIHALNSLFDIEIQNGINFCQASLKKEFFSQLVLGAVVHIPTISEVVSQ